MDAPNCLAILAILAEMARRLKENIDRGHATSSDSTFASGRAVNMLKLLAGVSKI